MKKLLALMAVLSVVVVVVFIRCGSNNSGGLTTGGTPGLLQGTLFDVNGDPVVGGTVWIQGNTGAPKLNGQNLLISNGTTCPDTPGTESPTAEGCTGLTGNFLLDCSTIEGTIILDGQDTNGQRLGNGDLDGDGETDIAELNCGTSSILTVDEDAADPSPTPSPTP